jgi:hypothetical protein
MATLPKIKRRQPKRSVKIKAASKAKGVRTLKNGMMDAKPTNYYPTL